MIPRGLGINVGAGSGSAAAGGAFSESAGDPAAVDPFAAGGAGGFISVATGVGSAGSATVVWAAPAPGVVAVPGFRSRVEICEKPSAASLAPAGQPAPACGMAIGVVAERATSMVAAMVLN